MPTELASVVESERPTARRSGMFRALSNRNYRIFWTGAFLSNVGTWMQAVAQGWLVLKLTNSPLWLRRDALTGSGPGFHLHARGRRLCRPDRPTAFVDLHTGNRRTRRVGTCHTRLNRCRESLDGAGIFVCHRLLYGAGEPFISRDDVRSRRSRRSRERDRDELDPV